MEALLTLFPSTLSYVKNRIARAWSVKPTRGEEATGIAEQDRAVVRGSLLPTISGVPAPLRVHIASAVHSIVRADYPEAWPTLLDEILKLLTSTSESDIYAGVRALLETVRSFRFTDTDSKLEDIVSRTFPQLLATANALMDSPHSNLPAVGEILYYAIKTYKISMLVTLTQHQQSEGSIVPWGTLLLRIVQKPVEDADLDVDAREKTPWWKTKKWAYFSLNKLFSRYGIPSQLSSSMKSYKPFAETFSNHFAPEILKVYLQVCEANITQNAWISRPVTRSILTFLNECIKPKTIWLRLRPQMPELVQSFVYPRMCFLEEDEELWELDPIDFIRSRTDVLEDMGTVASAASTLLHTAVTKRTKSMFEPTLAFIMSVMNAYPANCNARQLDGALNMCITIAKEMTDAESVRDKLDLFFFQHVLPLLKSEHAFLRLSACTAVKTFDHVGMKWHNAETLEMAFRGVMDCIMDAELPVRVQAAEAIGELIGHDEVHNAMAPNAARLMQEFLKLSDETDLDVLMTTQEKVVNTFAEELLPFAVQLVQQLASIYMRLVRENLAGGDAEADGAHAFNMDQNEEDKYFAALGNLSTMYQMVSTAESRPEILAELEQVILPAVALTIETETIDLFDDCFQLTDVLTYYQKRISPAMWNVFALMYKSFKGIGIDYLSEMIGTLDNCASYGTEMLQQNEEYRNMLLDIFNTAITSDQLGISDRIAACQLAEVILLLLKGYVDGALERIITALLPHSRKNSPEPSFSLRKWSILVLLEALYYNPNMALQVLDANGATAEFFTDALQMLPKFKRVHECKVTIVSLLSILSVDPNTLPEAIKAGYAHLLRALTRQLKLLPVLVAQRVEVQRALDEGFDENDEEEAEEENDVDDDADVQDDDNEYLELLIQEAARLRTKVTHIDNGEEEEEEEDDLELEDIEDDDLIYESPLENVPVYEPFRSVVHQLQTQHAALFQSLTEGMSKEEQEQFQQVYAIQDGVETGLGKPEKGT
ncbi:Nonsense-mediated mRNA decay protein 5 [Malassezia vespertilionis]|uniref:Nonsense-mediated mRNA decay protein 5 n=1 Tax=Malassezia vespertilionis TaxID=2020962 RepID=UPI0024B2399F|nr:Nonsense-mediated mRNA decay protein 5 [Malassezia vespertilionis]WFD08591.1 Nonsense-mediated mRNA decay protein 5 [Malassezia vespertilionis]